MKMELEKIKGDGFNWSSKELAEWTGKRHDNVMRDIKDEIIKLKEGGMSNFTVLNFEDTLYTNEQNGQEYHYYKLTRLGIQQIAMRYSAVVRAKVNMKLEEVNEINYISYLDKIDDKLEEMEKEISEKRKKIRLKRLLVTRTLESKNDSVYLFFNECLKPGEDDISSTKLHEIYLSYCVKNNHVLYGRNTFISKLRSLGLKYSNSCKVKLNDNKFRGFKNIKLKD